MNPPSRVQSLTVAVLFLFRAQGNGAGRRDQVLRLRPQL